MEEKNIPGNKKRKKRRRNNQSLILMVFVMFILASFLLVSTARILLSENKIERTEGMGSGAAMKEEKMNSELKTDEERLEDVIKECVPLLFQWDMRWKNKIYGNDTMEVTGCGPTCLSMVAMYLLKRTDLTPDWMADFSIQNGFCVPGSGTSWSFMSEGAAMLGLDVCEATLDKIDLKNNLKEGNPVICIMGPGDFTEGGHFIVLTDWEEDGIVIRDPNSLENSEKLWKYEEIEGQIRNMWVYKQIIYT